MGRCEESPLDNQNLFNEMLDLRTTVVVDASSLKLVHCETAVAFETEQRPGGPPLAQKR